MPYRRPAGLALALLVVLTGAAMLSRPSPVSGQSLGCAVGPADLAVDAEEQAALEAVNTLRAESRLAPLGVASTLTQAAAWKAASMAATGRFGHDDAGRGWFQRINECGYRTEATENIALGIETGRAAVAMWRDSAAHRFNMLDPSARVAGIARARAAGGAWYWTAVFGRAAESPVTDRPTLSPVAATAPPAVTVAPAPAAAPAALLVGATVVVNAGQGDCLNVRGAPSKGAWALACLPDGAAATITAGPREVDGITWWQLDGTGWASGEFLVAAGAMRPSSSR